MSSEIAIKVENLSKCFKIYEKPRDRLKQFVIPRLCRAIPPLARIFSTSSLRHPVFYKEFWALKDVSFEIKKGETVGIIGRNGSGKSTLLQMICGTLNPTTGNINTSGRIAALLELGSGFNPEFTGRENVYMNAAVIGLSKEETDARYDEIVAFADIGDFVSQPVKTYSSGMMVRLAFSVAVHVDPDILIVDEALAVGDVVFQMKCLERMEQIRSHGVTIFFVSHSLEQVKRFCTSAIWLEHGEVQKIGESNYVTDLYRDRSLRGSPVAEMDKAHTHRPSVIDAPAMLKSIDVSATELAPFERLAVQIKYQVEDRPLPSLLLGVAIRDVRGTYIFGSNTHLDKVQIAYTPGIHALECVIDRLPLLSGTFVLDVGLFSDGGLVCIDYISAAAEVCVISNYFCEGVVYIDHEWRPVFHEQ